MSAYPMVETKLYQPISEPVPDGALPGERVVTTGIRVLTCWGRLTRRSARLETTPLGEAARERFRWRGQVPDDVEPEPGWRLEAVGRCFRIIGVTSTRGRAWLLDLERID
jgi:hypothetical protein